MDTSKEFIELCRQAKEIQALWRPDNGDYALQPDGNVNLLWSNYLPDKSYRWVLNTTWLPRQDQLQEMVFEGSIWVLLNRFHGFVFNIYKRYDKDMTMEQLWLHYVMRLKFNKSWENKDWVKE